MLARPSNDEEVAAAGRDADGMIFHGAIPFTREIISRLNRCKVVCRTGVGVDRLDLAAAAERGIVVCNAAGCNSIEVAEQMIGLLIATSRKLVRMNQYVRRGALAPPQRGAPRLPRPGIAHRRTDPGHRRFGPRGAAGGAPGPRA